MSEDERDEGDLRVGSSKEARALWEAMILAANEGQIETLPRVGAVVRHLSSLGYIIVFDDSARV